MARKPVPVECKEKEAFTLYGLWVRSNIYSAETEWEHPMMVYTARSGDKGKRYVILENTNEQGECDLFVGGHTPGKDTSEYTVPAGLYASAVVTPKLGFLWGGAIDSANFYLRSDWPKEQGVELDDFRMEVRDMLGKKPSIEIIYRVKQKTEEE